MADPLYVAPQQEKGPDNPSSDYCAMRDYWEMVRTINGGAAAMRKAGEKYLPQFPEESQKDYQHRLASAPFTNIYSDVSRNLASKPFSQELHLKEGSDQALIDLCEDIDTQGNNLHVFASTIFRSGLDKGIDWIFVDYTKAPPAGERPRTVAEEKSARLRPYWIHVPAERMLAAYSDMIDGKEQFIHCRIKEDSTDRVDWEETCVERVRVLNRQKLPDGSYGPATFQIYQAEKQSDGKIVWNSIEGPSLITIGVIPVIPFLAGRRIDASWQVTPPLRDVAHLQIEVFQQEANLKSVKELTCFPMLVGSGVAGTDDKGKAIRVPVGPRGVLFAPQAGDGKFGDWKFIEPSSASINALMKHLEDTQKNMRDLGMQPLTQANLTVITTANVSLKAHSLLQALALSLKDALEQAFVFTCQWLKNANNPEVDIYTDFGVDMEAGTELQELNKAQAQGILSKRTVQEEFRRRGVLSDNFDPDEEEARLATEEQGLQPEVAIDPVTGEQVLPSTRPKVVTVPPQPGAGAAPTVN
jgi:hypothetical protein